MLQSELEKYGLEIVQNQHQTQESRKQLTEQTKAFRKQLEQTQQSSVLSDPSFQQLLKG